MALTGDIRYGIIAWADATGSAKALTTSPVDSDYGVIPVEDRANLLRLWVTLSGTAVDGVDIQLTPAKRGQIDTSGIEPIRNLDSVSSGVATFSEATYRLDFSSGAKTGVTVPVDIPVVPGYAYMVSAARIGGDATSSALITADWVY